MGQFYSDLLDPEVVCSKLGIVDAQVDASIDTCGILDLRKQTD